MRILTVDSVSMGVSPGQEAAWPQLARMAVDMGRTGKAPAAYVWFRTDQGVAGVIPVTEPASVEFEDAEEPPKYIGVVTVLGAEAEPTT